MAYLSTIIEDIEKRYSIKVHGNYHSKQTIDGIRFLDKNDISISYLYPNVIYLTNFREKYSKDLVGNILCVGCDDQIPEGNTLYIAESLDLYELHNIIENSLQSYRQVEISKASLFHTLYMGKGLSTLLENGYKMIRNPIVVCDSSYNVLASYPEVSDEKFLEIRNHRLSLKEIFTDNMKKSQTIDRIYHTVYPFVTEVKDAEFPMIFESIRIKRAVVGYICVRCLEKNYEENDLEIIHSLTQMISIQLQKDDTYNNPNGIKYDMFLKDLFEKQLDGEEAARKHLSFLGVEPKQYYFIMISGFTNVKSHSMTNTYYWNQLTSIFKNSITGVFGNRFVTLVSTSDKDSFFEKLSSRLETFLQMNHMLAAVSYSFDQLWDASVYAEQCNSLLTERLVVYNESPILFYEDYYLKHLINMTKNPAAIKASVHPDIKDMIKYDASQGTEYIHTLKTYFEHNRSMPATAKALFIHKSTLFYRFDKMKQLFNIDIIDAEKLFIYEYSLRILSV